MREMSDGQKGCALLVGIPLIMLFAIFNFVFVLLPRLIFAKVRKLFGPPKRG
jgi:hypothetical protein